MLSVLPSCPVHSQWLNSGMVCRDCGRYLICLFVIRCCFHCNNGHWIWVVECLIRFRPFRISLADRRANHPGPFGTEAAPSNNFFFFFSSCLVSTDIGSGMVTSIADALDRRDLICWLYSMLWSLVLFIRCLFLKLIWYVRLPVYVCWPKGEPIRGTQAASSQKTDASHHSSTANQLDGFVAAIGWTHHYSHWSLACAASLTAVSCAQTRFLWKMVSMSWCNSILLMMSFWKKRCYNYNVC